MATLGRGKAAKLSESFGGEKLPLARCRSVERVRRNAEIIALKNSGESIKAIAELFSLTEKAVFYIIDPIQAEANKTRQKARRKAARGF